MNLFRWLREKFQVIQCRRELTRTKNRETWNAVEKCNAELAESYRTWQKELQRIT